MHETVNASTKYSNSLFRELGSISELYCEGGPGPRGGPQLQKNWDFGGIKLQIFCAEGAENFEKLRFLMENWLFFGVLSDNLA